MIFSFFLEKENMRLKITCALWVCNFQGKQGLHLVRCRGKCGSR